MNVQKYFLGSKSAPECLQVQYSTIACACTGSDCDAALLEGSKVLLSPMPSLVSVTQEKINFNFSSYEFNAYHFASTIVQDYRASDLTRYISRTWKSHSNVCKITVAITTSIRTSKQTSCTIHNFTFNPSIYNFRFPFPPAGHACIIACMVRTRPGI
eukprot:scpid106193/ scgid12876/ 